jgi:hypothetical protein
MKWKLIRLELAQSDEFPNGSASRAYLLRLPLQDDGSIDAPAISKSPARATVRRFWPNEADLSGYVTASDGEWAFVYDANNDDAGTIVRHDSNPIRLGEAIILTELDGRRFPYRVTSLNGSR